MNSNIMNSYINWPPLPVQPIESGPNINSFNLNGQTDLNINQNNLNNQYIMNKDSSGTIVAAAGDDTFDYVNSPGTLNTFLDGGSGVDTFALSALTGAESIKALANAGYQFIQKDNGFALRLNGQEIMVSNVEIIKFADQEFDLRNDTDVMNFINALRDGGVEIVDETYQAHHHRHHHSHLVPVYMVNNSFVTPNTNYLSAYQGLSLSNSLNGTGTSTANASSFFSLG